MRQILLASGSPRRRELIDHMGIMYKVVPSAFDEWLDDDRTVEDMAKELGLGKALDVAKRHPEALVIGSDTIVTLHGKQLGKQPDVTTTKRLLRKMSGQTVEVITSVALVCEATGLREVAVDRAAIVYAQYDDAAIDAFLATNDWQDKAGATAVQSPHSPAVDHIKGDYDTVLGLSTRLLARMLTEQGVEANEYHPIAPVRHIHLVQAV
jgi:septum formation protein